MQQPGVPGLARQAGGLVQRVQRGLALGGRSQKAGVGAQPRQAAGLGRRVAQRVRQRYGPGLQTRESARHGLRLIVGQMPEGQELGRRIPFAAGRGQRSASSVQAASQIPAIVPERPLLKIQAGAEAGRRRCGVGLGDRLRLLAPGQRFVVGYHACRLLRGGQSRFQCQPGPVAGGVMGRHAASRCVHTRQRFCGLAVEQPAPRLAQRLVRGPAHQLVPELVTIRWSGLQEAFDR